MTYKDHKILTCNLWWLERTQILLQFINRKVKIYVVGLISGYRANKHVSEEILAELVFKNKYNSM